jgi:hypothetical protein
MKRDFERMNVSSWVIRELGPAAAGRFHDDMHVAIFCKGRQVDEIRHDEVSNEYWGVGGQRAPN